MKKWGISLLGEMPHFIILVILFAANLLNGRIEGRIGYRSILAVMYGNHFCAMSITTEPSFKYD
uniref:Uncharacterized protein n=1 Tax=Siphoviridae sp. ctcfw7 TaxID=2826394 RepID=A0A8S5MGE5_9CAUD|nr:MAG TPA: hypothetical protein [Siphoviridae sp. ctcfw7]